MAAAVHDDMFTSDVIADPNRYYGRLRDEDPVHWNDTYGLWVITRHDDVTWLTRHHELFSSAVFKNDPRRLRGRLRQKPNRVRGLRRSSTRYTDLAEADIESPLCEIVDFWRNKGLSRLVTGDASITLVATQSSGFG